MILGVDYHPEQWPEERWPEDVRLMKEAGVRVVRLAEFAWSHIEPDDNYYSLRWLNRVMDLLLKNGIKVMISIPTGAPPPWLVHKFPDILPMDADGQRLQPGTYNHRCFLNKHYRDYARNFAMRLTKDIWGHRGILGWQIDNRLTASRCYCETCHLAFLAWLEKTYGNIDHLNLGWGTAAWGQEYGEFTEIPLPWRRMGAAVDVRATNPSMVLDFWRFSAEVVAEFAREQALIIKRYTTRQYITLTFSEARDGQNNFELAKSLDFPSLAFSPIDPGGNDDALTLDVTRSLKQKPFWVMEQQIGAMGTNELGPSPRPGQARMYAWQAVAHGADAVLFSKWRPSPSGAEQLSEGVLGHDAVPRRRYREVQKLGEEFGTAGKVIDESLPINEVGILWEVEQIWAFQIQRQTTGPGICYADMARRFHKGLRRIGVGCDMVGWGDDFSRYKLLLFPSQYLLDVPRAKKVTDYVEKGGRAVFSVRSGIKDLRNISHTETAPALLRDLLGMEVAESDVLGGGRVNRVRLQTGGEFEAALWCDLLELKGAQALGSYTMDYYKDSPAVTGHGFGKGKAYYVGAVMAADFHHEFLRGLCEEAALRVYKDLPVDVEVVSRHKQGKEFVFVMNQGGEQQQVNICRKGKNLLSKSAVDSVLVLESYGVAVVEIEKEL